MFGLRWPERGVGSIDMKRADAQDAGPQQLRLERSA